MRSPRLRATRPALADRRALLVAVLAAAWSPRAVLTSGFGLVGGDERQRRKGGGKGAKEEKERSPRSRC